MYYLLLAMQAAGMVTDYIGTKQQAEMMGMGSQLEQLGIEANIQQTRLAAEDESLQSMKNLRKNLGTQLAVLAARGTASNAGNAIGIMNESLSNFYADERTRRLNLLGKETALRGQGLISSLNAGAEKSKLWQGFASRTINKFPSTPEGWDQYSKAFGLTQKG
jgi:hypothetical protein